MGLIADKIVPQLVIDKMLEVFGEDRIVHPEHQPKVFEYQFKLAKWLVNLDNKPKEEIIDSNQEKST